MLRRNGARLGYHARLDCSLAVLRIGQRRQPPHNRRLPRPGRTGHDPHAVFRCCQPIHERAQQSRATGEIPTALADLDPARRQIEMLRTAGLRQTPRALLNDLRNQTGSMPGVGKQLDR
jgi:hypothetical protein